MIPPRVAWQRIVVLGGPIRSLAHYVPASTYAKSFIKVPLDEADAGSLKLTNYLTD